MRSLDIARSFNPCCRNCRCLRVSALGRRSNRGRNVDGSNFEAPKQLLSTVVPDQSPPNANDLSEGHRNDLPLTVYTLRVQTSHGRGASLDDTTSAVSVLLIGQHGSLLHRISPVCDYSEQADTMDQVCQVVDDSAGANCGALGTQKMPHFPFAMKHRFLDGSVDEVMFVGPDIGTLKATLIGPESGTWGLEELDVVSSRTAKSQRFVCNQIIGAKGEHSAAFLTAVPHDAVVYGSGTRSKLVSEEQAEKLRISSLTEYDMLKAQLMLMTVTLVALGSAAVASVGGSAAAEAFLIGGSLGIAYQWLLQRAADAIGQPQSALVDDGGLGANIVSSAAFRLLFVGGAAFGAVLLMQHDTPSAAGEVVARGEAVRDMAHVFTGFAGFMMYKLAVVLVGLFPRSVVVNQEIKSYQNESK